MPVYFVNVRMTAVEGTLIWRLHLYRKEYSTVVQTLNNGDNHDNKYCKATTGDHLVYTPEGEDYSVACLGYLALRHEDSKAGDYLEDNASSSLFLKPTRSGERSV